MAMSWEETRVEAPKAALCGLSGVWPLDMDQSSGSGGLVVLMTSSD